MDEIALGKVKKNRIKQIVLGGDRKSVLAVKTKIYTSYVLYTFINNNNYYFINNNNNNIRIFARESLLWGTNKV